MWNWLENRLGLKTSWRKFLEERLPDRVGWPHVLGSVLLALIAFQFLTGLLLSFLYSASPDGAHASVRYISEELRGGDWIRALHYWGASFVIVIAALHLIRTYLYAAYRRPRELTWIAGLLLLLCILAFGQTGYLLPWDQRSYWGTNVTLQIVSTVPVIGPAIAQFLRGGDAVGALTLSRFYSLHVIVLPLMTAGLILLHLLLIRRYGITDPWSRTGQEGPRRTPFYPYQMAKDAIAVFMILAVLIFIAWHLPAPLDSPADPTDTTVVPRPDWYFLFLFQLLKYFEGPWEIVGTFLIPAGLLLFLFLLPFLDRNPRRELKRRPFAVSGLLLALILFCLLTYAAVQETPIPSPGMRPAGSIPPRNLRIKRPSEVGGMYLLKRDCFACHSMTVMGERPDLQTLAKQNFPSGKAWLEQHLRLQRSDRENPVTFESDQIAEELLKEKEAEELMAVLRLIASDRTDLLIRIPPAARFGAHFFYNSSCPVCHTIDGQGGQEPEVPSPDLTFRLLRTKQWHVKHIYDPQSLVPKSKMPPFFHYEPEEYDALADYLLYLHTP